MVVEIRRIHVAPMFVGMLAMLFMIGTLFPTHACAVRPAISAGAAHVVGLKSDGTVLATGQNTYGQCGVTGWTSIKAIAAGDGHTVGLKSDGTVVASGRNDYGQSDVSTWTEITAVSAGSDHTVGVKQDGTVVATGRNLYGQCDVSTWTDITSVSAGAGITVGLKSDGNVVWTRYGDLNWTNIIALSRGPVGVRADGTVVALAYDGFPALQVSGWSGITDVAAGWFHIVGLKADGTIVAAGNALAFNPTWTNISAIAANTDFVIGLSSDGSVRRAGTICNYPFDGWQLLVPASLNIDGAGTFPHGGTHELSGTLRDRSGAPFAGQTIILQSSSSAAGPWTSDTTTITSGSGGYSFDVTPTYCTFYRALFQGDAENGRTSKVAWVRVGASLTPPALDSAAVAGRPLHVTGLLDPRHPAGSRDVRIEAYRLENERWTYKSSFTAIDSDYSDHTRYIASVTFPTAGYWRLRAYRAPDTTNAGTYSGWTSVRVVRGTPSLSGGGSGTIAYGGSRTLSGLLKNSNGVPLSGRRLTLQYKSSPTSGWKSMTTKATTSSTGRYAFRVGPKTNTYYRIVFSGDGGYRPAASTTLYVPVRVSLTAPVTGYGSVIQLGHPVRLWGYLKPHHPAGAKSIQIKLYRKVSGRWVLQKTLSATNYDYMTYTLYVCKTVFTSTGSWAVHAVHLADANNAATQSTWSYFTVVLQ